VCDRYISVASEDNELVMDYCSMSEAE
jgi:hypothetical protein